ncbi:MAG: hypothetical protein HOP17_15260 [Acidobacteria bacterium]|nr:hypothetical protein [Acidobacteriota bacterium]
MPKTTTDLPFFNLTYRRKDIPKAVKYEGIDPAGHPISWQVFHNTNEEVGPAGVEAHEVWYLLIKPAIDSKRKADGTIPQIIPLGGMRHCLRMVGWSEGGHQARELIKCLTQIAFAGCVADLWFPTGEIDEDGKEKFLQIKSRFSRMSVYAIGEHHLTAEELKDQQFEFDLEDQLYIRLDPIEVQMQQLQAQQHRLIDNEYMFSVKPIARRWYELLAGKIYGTLKYNAPFFEIKYSWYIKHHHTLKKFNNLKRVTAQMNRVVQDHLDSGFLTRVEYRKFKEPDQELDFSIRYFVGAAAKSSINRIQGHISNRRKKEVAGPVSVKESQNAKNDQISGVRSEDGIEVPLEAKVVSEALNFDAQEKAEERRAVELAITTLETHLLPRQRELLTLMTVDFMITESRAYELLMEYPVYRVDLQVQAFEWRTTGISNKAGFLINAIEQNYALPDKFRDHLRAIEFEKEQTARQEREEELRSQKEILIAACAICDQNGNRNIKLPEDPNYKAVHQCSHDPAIESTFEDWIM